MKINIKLPYSILIIFFIIFSPTFVQASETKNIIEHYSYSNKINKKYFNESIISKDKKTFKLHNKEQVNKALLSYNNNYCNTMEQLEELAKDNILNKNTNFLIHYTGNLSDLSGPPKLPYKVMDYVTAYDNYAGYCVITCNTTIHGSDNNLDINFDVTYLLSQDEESWVDNKVDSILQNIIKNSMTQDQKEKAIHDYIISNVTYDETAKKNSPYNALHDGSTMC